MLVLKVDGQFTDSSLTKLERDPLLAGAGGGVRYLFDTAFNHSYSGGPPSNGTPVRDVSDHADGAFALASGQTVGFAGGGFDFSTLTSTNGSNVDNYVNGGAGAWAGIFAAQHYLVAGYYKMPADADWAMTAILPIFASGVGGGYPVEADPLLITMNLAGAAKRIAIRRQTGLNTYDALANDLLPGNLGAVCQIAAWRDATGTYVRQRGPGGTAKVSGAVGALNTVDFSAARPKWGLPPPFSDASNAGFNTQKKFRLYRGWLENLALSGRNAETVLDADYERTIARGVFS